MAHAEDGPGYTCGYDKGYDRKETAVLVAHYRYVQLTIL